jgi:putative addiction module killer protein
MFKVSKTEHFSKWFKKLKDMRSKIKIARRIDKIEHKGHFGEFRPIGEGLSELIFTEGKGYRVYYGTKNKEIIILLVGGNKATQAKDIAKAKEIWKNLN